MRLLKYLSVILCIAGIAMAVWYAITDMKVLDQTAPKINVPEGVLEVSVDAADQDLLAGVTAVDDIDGNVTNSLMVESISNFDADYERTVSIVAFDGSNNVARTQRTIRYTDYTHPHLALSAPLEFATSATNLTANLSAQDVIDGDITDRILTYNSGNSKMDKSVAGEYKVYYTVSNSAGDTTGFTATVTIGSSGTTGSYSVRLSDYLIYLKQGEGFDPATYVIYHGVVTNEESVAIMQQADFLVNIGNNTLNMLPSKILTYISTGKPILNIIKHPECPTLPYMEKYPLVLNILETSEVQQKDVDRVRDFILNYKGKQIPFEEIKEKYYTCTPKYVGKQLYDVICSVVKENEVRSKTD